MSVIAAHDEVLKNHLLASLSADEVTRLRPNLTTLSLSSGDVLYESGQNVEYVYFPTSAIVSLLYITENGATAGLAVVGKEGLVGIALFMGSNTTPNLAIVQSAGRLLRMKGTLLRDEFRLVGPFHDLLLRYTQALITQISQTAVCSRLHSVDQQLCRWFLLSHDRLSSNHLFMTHELIAIMLGVRRESISQAAKRLQDAGVIRYARGDMTILDRSGLEASACECYQVVKNEYRRLLQSSL